jgi:hypothetical protein
MFFKLIMPNCRHAHFIFDLKVALSARTGPWRSRSKSTLCSQTDVPLDKMLHDPRMSPPTGRRAAFGVVAERQLRAGSLP